MTIYGQINAFDSRRFRSEGFNIVVVQDISTINRAEPCGVSFCFYGCVCVYVCLSVCLCVCVCVFVFRKCIFQKCYFRKCIFQKFILWKCIFLKYFFRKCTFRKCIFRKCIFWKCIASMQVFWVQTFLTQWLPSPNFFKLSVPGGLRIFRAFASLFHWIR